MKILLKKLLCVCVCLCIFVDEEEEKRDFKCIGSCVHGQSSLIILCLYLASDNLKASVIWNHNP